MWQKPGGISRPVERFVMPYFRVWLLKNSDANRWVVHSNPSWDYTTKAFSDVLLNSANKYVEYKNCDVLHRMIRFESINDYLEDVSDFNYNWALNPEEA